jgi:sterol desaturase/sphingolipid hydroxylase (fatty acid hydroxylase superfamily)
MKELLANEQNLRLAVFAGMLLILIVAESFFVPGKWRAQQQRWSSNLALVVLGSVAIKICMPIAASAVALQCSHAGIGILHQLDLPIWLHWLFAIMALDLAIYWQHRAFHWSSTLFRLHQVHHSDAQFDVSLGVRFHPFELMLSMLIKFVAIAIIGPAAEVVIVFEALLSATALATHTALELPNKLDQALRWIFVTPSMHRVHHSDRHADSMSNFGFCLSIWDRLFGSYQVVASKLPIEFGTRDLRTDSLWGLLKAPFGAGRRG